MTDAAEEHETALRKAVAINEMNIALAILRERGQPLDAWEKLHLADAVKAFEGGMFVLAREYALKATVPADRRVALAEKEFPVTIDSIAERVQQFASAR